MKKNFFITVLIALFFISNAYSQILAWNFSLPETKGNEQYIVASVKDSRLKKSELVRGSGLNITNTLPRTFISKVPLIGKGNNTKEKAFEQNVYYEFRLQPKKGFKVNLESLEAKFRPGAGGPFFYRWTYSLDGKQFIEIGNRDQCIQYENSKSEGEIQPKLILSGINDLQNITSKKGVFFRVYIWGATNPNTSTFSIGKSDAGKKDSYVLTINGKVAKDN